jgi:ABC-type amino acid transport substrate-binding protein
MCCQLWALDKNRLYRFAVDINYPPFSSIDDKTGQPVGFDVDISMAVCKYLGIQCEVVGVNFDEIIPMIQKGELDVGAAGMGYTAERAEIVLYTDKYYRSNSIFVQNDLDLIEVTPETIKGRTVAVQRGTMQEAYLRDTFKENITILLCNNIKDVMNAVKDKRADLGFSDGIASYSYLKTDAGKTLDIAGDPVPMNDDDCLMVVNKSLPELRDGLNEAILGLRSTGEYDRINLKYFDYNIY